MHWKKHVWRYSMVAAGSLIAGMAINLFLIPHQLFSGGVSGVAMILYFLFGWPIGVQIIVLNIPIFYAAYRLLDRDYVLCGIFGMLVFSAAADATRFLSTIHLVDDTLLAAIYGGVISGIGSGLPIPAPADVVDRLLHDPLLLAVFVVLAGIVGVLAAWWPGRRAANLNVLRAISTE